MSLTTIEKEQVRATFSKFESQTRTLIPANKSGIRQVINAIDTWVEDNQASFNQAIPEPMRTDLTLRQKLLIFEYVLNRRYLNE